MSVLLLSACGADDEYKQQLKESEKRLEETKKDSERLEKISNQIDETGESLKELQDKFGPEGFLTKDQAQELIDYQVLGENDILKDVEIQGNEIKAVIEIVNDIFSDKSIVAESMYSSAGDAFLEYGGWEVLTIEFEGIGMVSMNRNEKETNEYGMDYFPLEKIIYQLN